MKKNEITLSFDKMITNLAGNRFGYDIYKEQVKNRIKKGEENIIVFPINIEDIASSFIEGMYKELGEEYGKLTALEIMILHADNSEADNKIKEVIETYGV